MKQSTLDNNRRQQLKLLGNKLLFQFSLHKIKTFADLLKHAGWSANGYFTSELSQKITRPDLLDWLSDRKIELETELWLRDNPPIITYDEQEKDTTDVTRNHERTESNLLPSIIYNVGLDNIEQQLRQFKPKKIKQKWEQEMSIPQIPGVKAKLMWFQKKAFLEIQKRLGIENKPKETINV